MKKPKEYVKCEHCGVIEELVTDERDMMDEVEQYFGRGWDKKDLAIVCDDCFQKMHPKDHPDLVKQAAHATPNKLKKVEDE